MPAGGAYIGYTVPAGKRAVIKSIDACNLTATPVSLVLFIGSTRFEVGPIAASPGAQRWYGHQVAYAGETIAATATTANAISLLISGYLLTA